MPSKQIEWGGDEPQHAGKRSEEHTSELQSPCNLVCRLLLEKKKKLYDQPTVDLHQFHAQTAVQPHGCGILLRPGHANLLKLRRAFYAHRHRPRDRHVIYVSRSKI